jgi:hypothetical protein
MCRFVSIGECSDRISLRCEQGLLVSPTRPMLLAFQLGTQLAIQQIVADPVFRLTPAEALSQLVVGFREMASDRGWTEISDDSFDGVEFRGISLTMKASADRYQNILEPDPTAKDASESEENDFGSQRQGLLFGIEFDFPPEEREPRVALLAIPIFQRVINERLDHATVCFRPTTEVEAAALITSLKRKQ